MLPAFINARRSARAGLALLAAASCLGLLRPLPVQSQSVDVFAKLLFSISTSNSISTPEYELQQEGWAFALSQPDIIDRITSTAGAGGIAVAITQWAQTDNTLESPWTILKTEADVNAFAAVMQTLPRGNEGTSTCIECALVSGVDYINNAALLNGDPINSSRNIIDISGNGQANQCRDPGSFFFGIFQNCTDISGTTFTGPAFNPYSTSTTGGPLAVLPAAVQRAVDNNITVNGLAITNDVPGLDAYYQANVISSEGFVVAADGFDNFNSAALTKVSREIDSVIPAPLPLSGLLPLGFMLKRLATIRSSLLETQHKS